MTEHTKGPWELDESLRGNSFTAISGDDWIELATVVTRMNMKDEDSPEGMANARLISAAPDLLAALEWAVETADTEQYEADWYAAARVAIAKARGVRHEAV